MPALEYRQSPQKLRPVNLSYISVRRPTEAGPNAHLYRSARVLLDIPDGVLVGSWYPPAKNLPIEMSERAIKEILKRSNRLVIPDGIHVVSSDDRLTILAPPPYPILMSWFRAEHGYIPVTIVKDASDEKTHAALLLDGKVTDCVSVFAFRERPVRVSTLKNKAPVLVPGQAMRSSALIMRSTDTTIPQEN